MLATINHKNEIFQVDFLKPIDISLPLSNTDKNPIAWYLEKPVMAPVVVDNWIGKVSNGATTNFNTIRFNPHGHGTHTECLGHITHDFYSINQILKTFFFVAELLSVVPEKQLNDYVITKNQLEKLLQNKNTEALVIRTLPNLDAKQSAKYSNTNPPFLTEEAALFIKDCNIQHLLIDLPSVDKEKDDGKLAAHKAFWNIKNTKKVNTDARFNATITELVYVSNHVKDGKYLLNLQIASFENDASPSKPILYKIM